MENTKNFTSGKILMPLIEFALPVLLALFLQTMYGAVDLLIVGQFGSTADVSAVSTGTFIMQTITSAITGLAMGTTILIGKKMGEQRISEITSIIGASIVLFALLAIAISFGMQFLAAPFAYALQAPEEAYASTVSYVRICSSGAIFIVAYNVLGSIFRGMGNSKLPLITVSIACIFNIIGDWFLVAKLHMASNGAALATVFAQAISVLLSILLIRQQKTGISLSLKDVRLSKDIIHQIICLGFPIAFQDVLVSLSFLAITAIVNGLGVIASAGVGIAEKICGFIMLVPSAYSQSISAFVAQNMGASKPERAIKALRYAITTSLGVGVLIAYVSFFHGDLLAALFAGDKPDVIVAAAQYLKAYAIDCLFVSFLFCFIGYFNGCGNTKFVMVQGIIGSFGVRIPVSLLMSHLFPESLFRIGLATPCSTITQILMCFIFLIFLQKHKSPLNAHQ